MTLLQVYSAFVRQLSGDGLMRRTENPASGAELPPDGGMPIRCRLGNRTLRTTCGKGSRMQVSCNIREMISLCAFLPAITRSFQLYDC